MFQKLKKIISGKKSSLKKKTKKAVKKPAKKTAEKKKKEKPIGKVTHYFGNIKVAVVKCSANIRAGTKAEYRGATTSFSDVIVSMQKDHVPVRLAKKGTSVGIKVKKKVREGDRVYCAK
jgi:hypothetical protein